MNRIFEFINYISINYPNYIPPLIGSAVTITFIFLYDVYNSRKEDKAILNAFKRELELNKATINTNINMLKEELKILEDPNKDGIMAPTNPFK